MTTPPQAVETKEKTGVFLRRLRRYRAILVYRVFSTESLRALRNKRGRKDEEFPPIERLNRKIGREQRRRTFFLMGAFLPFLLCTLFWTYRTGGENSEDIFTYSVLAALAALAVVCLAAAQDKRWLIKRLEEDLQEKEFEEELSRTDSKSPERRAEKLLSLNQHQLRRYYEQNLKQSSWIFLVGVACLAAGMAIVGVTLWLLASSEPPAGQDRWVVAVVGGVGSILTNYVAAVYLKMHAASAASMTGFHEKLVGTHELFFANVLASRTTETKRDEITGQIALAIVRGTRQSPHDTPPDAA